MTTTAVEAIGKAAARDARRAGLPGSVAIFAGDAAASWARGEGYDEWKSRHELTMFAMGTLDAALILDGVVDALVLADLYPWAE